MVGNRHKDLKTGCTGATGQNIVHALKWRASNSMTEELSG